jgi:hypothetical protein
LAPAVLTVDSPADDTTPDSVLTRREAVALVDGTLGRSLTAAEQAQVSGTPGSSDAIQFDLPAGPQTVTLTLGALAITRPVTITGPGAANLTVDGNGLDRVVVAGDVGAVEVQALATLTIPETNAPPPLPSRGITARLARVRVGRKWRLMVEVFSADTGALKGQFVSPFQGPAYKAIRVSVRDRNGDGVPDQVVVTARKGKRAVTAFSPANPLRARPRSRAARASGGQCATPAPPVGWPPRVPAQAAPRETRRPEELDDLPQAGERLRDHQDRCPGQEFLRRVTGAQEAGADGGVDGPQGNQGPAAAQLCGQDHQREAPVMPPVDRQGLRRADGLPHGEAVVPQARCQVLADGVVIFHEQDFGYDRAHDATSPPWVRDTPGRPRSGDC